MLHSNGNYILVDIEFKSQICWNSRYKQNLLQKDKYLHGDFLSFSKTRCFISSIFSIYTVYFKSATRSIIGKRNISEEFHKSSKYSSE